MDLAYHHLTKKRLGLSTVMHDQYHNIRVNDAVWQVAATEKISELCCIKAALVKGCRLTLVRSLICVSVVFAAPEASVADTIHANKEPSGSVATVVAPRLDNTERLEFTKVLDGMYVRYGRHEPVSAESIAGIANHGFIVGETGVAIIDPGGSVDIAKRTLAAVKKVTSLPVTHVIVSHVHPDHSLGLAAYTAEEFERKPAIFGHPTLAAALTHNLDFFKEHYASDDTVDRLLKLIHADQIHSVDEELIVDLGNRQIVVAAYDNAHSGSDISVYDQTTKALWAGDLLFVERLPAIDGSILGWLDALNQLGQYDIKTVIPGHGPIGDYATLVRPQLHYLNWVVARTREAIASGVSLNEFISNRDNSAEGLRAGWELFDTQHALNLSKSYAELEWE